MSADLKTVQLQGKAATIQFTVPATWEPVRALGSGAYATVAHFKGPSAEFAVKKVERTFEHPVLALRTLREIRLLGYLRHPNILGIRELFLEGPEFTDTYLVLELMDGDLNQLIHKNVMTETQLKWVLFQTLRGLLCLRKAHVLHRDLKPGNILIRKGGEVKIADLGLARTIDAEDDIDKDVLTEYVVTRYYRAPEVVLTATQYTYAVDMWSTGCILGEMLTRRPLFVGKDSLDQIRQIVSIMGTPTADEMSWIPRSGPSWKFVEKCAQTATGEGFQKILNWPGASPDATNLLAQMLRFDPSRRISVEDTLVHKFLEEFNADEDPGVAEARAIRPVDWTFDRDLCFDESGKSRPFEPKIFRRAFFEASRLIVGGDDAAAGAPGEGSPMSRGAPSPGGSPAAQVGVAIGAAHAGAEAKPSRWGRRWREGQTGTSEPGST